MRMMRLAYILLMALALAPFVNSHAVEELRLPELKEFYLKTVLVREGVPTAAIVVSDEPGYADLARQVAEAIKDLTGAELPVISDTDADIELSTGNGKKRAMIVLGNLATSKVSERLYCMEQLDVDAGWPGRDGYLVQTVHNPMGDGRNFVSLGGSDLRGVRMAMEAFTGHLKPDDRSLSVGRLFMLESRDKGPSPILPSEVNEVINRTGYTKPESAGKHAIECGYILRKYRTPGYGKLFRHAMQRLAVAFRNNEKFEENFPSFVTLPLLWDIIEESDQFDEDDIFDLVEQGVDETGFSDTVRSSAENTRELISNVLYAYACRLMYARQNTDYQWAGGNNHHAEAAFLAALYFYRYYPDLKVGQRLMERMDRYYAPPADGSAGVYGSCWKPADNCTGYGDATWHGNLRYALLRPDMRFFESGRVRMAADYIIVITTNCGRSSGFGDALSWTKNHYGYHSVMLNMAAWYYGDGSYLWWFKKCGGKPGMLYAWNKISPKEGRFIMSGLDEKPPAKWLGVKPYPLDHWLYAEVGGPKPEEAHAERHFDKMSFRAGFQPDNQYLLLSGFSGGYHGHPDGNAIINFSDNGCDFLYEAGYFNPDISEQNTLIVRRDGMGSHIPKLVRLDNIADFSKVAFTETTLTNYNGIAWSRNIIWAKERYFLVIEELEAEKEGGYSFNCIWRSHGEADLKGREFRATQKKETMHLVNMGGARQRVNCQEYGYKLSQSLDTELKKGDRAFIANLFFVHGPKDKPAIEVEEAGPGVVLVRENGRTALAGTGPCDGIAGLETDAALFYVEADVVHACGVKRLTWSGCTMRSDKPVSVWLDLGKGTGIVDAVESAHVDLSGATGTLDVESGKTAIRFKPVSRAEMEKSRTILRELFVAASASRKRENARREADARAEAGSPLSQNVNVLWKHGDFKSSENLIRKANALNATRLLEDGSGVDLNTLNKSRSPGDLELVGGGTSDANVENDIRWLEVTDLDGDCRSETLVAFADGVIHALSPGGTQVWCAAVGPSGLRGITTDLRAVVDLDGEKKIVAVGGRDSWFMTCMNANGSTCWEIPLSMAPEVLCASPPDATGGWQVCIGAFEYGYGYSDLGEPIWRILNQDKHDSTCGVVFDLNGDGTNEVVLGNDYSQAHVCNALTGRRLLSVRMTGHAGPSAVDAGDIDGDGKGDMVIGDRMGHLVFCVPWDNNQRTSRELAARIVFVRIVDLDMNGVKDVVVGADNGGVYVFDAKGKTVWHKSLDDVPRDIGFGDLDGDGRLDLLIDCEDDCVRILDDAGQSVGQFTTGKGVRFACAAELDGDTTRTEFVVGSLDGFVYALQLDPKGSTVISGRKR